MHYHYASLNDEFFMPHHIVFSFHKSRQHYRIMAATRIKVNSNGSLRIEGDFEIVDPTGEVYNINGRTSIALCRCGLSKTKPFCDGSHKGHFEHDSLAYELPPPAPKV